MSEYQYYEFAAIERPLTQADMAKLRAASARAKVTPAGFSNHYDWGDLKAEPADWMRSYFDAFVYTANWRMCQLMLRLPRSTFSCVELRAFEIRPALEVTGTKDHWIITWSLDDSEDFERFEMDDGASWMARLAPLRDELLRGDLRPLYLGWLAGTGFEKRDDALEPAPPPGLANLSAAQQSLAEFLEINPDMLTAAATASAVLDDSANDGALDAWLAQWSHHELVAVLKQMMQGQGDAAQRQVQARHSAWVKASQPPSPPGAGRRSVAQLHEAAEAASAVREMHESRERTARDAEQHRLHEAHLQQLMTNAKARWVAAEVQAQRGTAAGYEEAVSVLAELAEAYALSGTRQEFDLALGRMLTRHARRGALLRRLRQAGLWAD